VSAARRTFGGMSRSYFLLSLFVALWGCKSDPAPAPAPGVTPNPSVVTFTPPVAAEAVYYEVNLRALQPTPTFAGVTARLDSIKSLGANVLWLMPIHPIGLARRIPPLGSPYSVQNYTAVNPEFGTLADFRALVDAAHARGIAVVLDWVANHTAWDNPWLIAHPDWYTKDGAGNIVIPAGTNWQDVADLDYRSQPMRLEMIKALKYWVTETKVDGFRCDAADFVPADFWRQALDSLKRIPNRSLLFLAEGARSDHYAAGFQQTYGWDYYAQLKRIFGSEQAAAPTLFSAHDNELRGLPVGARKLRFTTNHDETAWDATPITLFGGTQGALAASVITVGMGQTPLIYNGQEVGCPIKLPLFDRSRINWLANSELLKAYRKLLRLYRASPALQSGNLARYTHPDVLAFTRKQGADEIFIVVNVRNRSVTYSLPVGGVWTEVLPGAMGSAALPSSLTLGAYEAHIWRR
jgi:glycosidase